MVSTKNLKSVHAVAVDPWIKDDGPLVAVAPVTPHTLSRLLAGVAILMVGAVLGIRHDGPLHSVTRTRELGP